MREGSFTVGDFVLFVSYLGFVAESTTFAGVFLTRWKQLAVSIGRMLALVGGGTAEVPASVLVAHTPLDLRGELRRPAPTAPGDPLRRFEASGLRYGHRSGRPG